jgi:hypothetical protein
MGMPYSFLFAPPAGGTKPTNYTKTRDAARPIQGRIAPSVH